MGESEKVFITPSKDYKDPHAMEKFMWFFNWESQEPFTSFGSIFQVPDLLWDSHIVYNNIMHIGSVIEEKYKYGMYYLLNTMPYIFDYIYFHLYEKINYCDYGNSPRNVGQFWNWMEASNNVLYALWCSVFNVIR